VSNTLKPARARKPRAKSSDTREHVKVSYQDMYTSGVVFFVWLSQAFQEIQHIAVEAAVFFFFPHWYGPFRMLIKRALYRAVYNVFQFLAAPAVDDQLADILRTPAMRDSPQDLVRGQMFGVMFGQPECKPLKFGVHSGIPREKRRAAYS
jgi:hypothetical protein